MPAGHESRQGRLHEFVELCHVGRTGLSAALTKKSTAGRWNYQALHAIGLVLKPAVAEDDGAGLLALRHRSAAGSRFCTGRAEAV